MPDQTLELLGLRFMSCFNMLSLVQGPRTVQFDVYVAFPHALFTAKPMHVVTNMYSSPQGPRALHVILLVHTVAQTKTLVAPQPSGRCGPRQEVIKKSVNLSAISRQHVADRLNL